MKYLLTIMLSLLLVIVSASAQTQDEFMAKLSDVYVNAADAKKALEAAKAAFAMVEKNEALQNYANYLMLSQVFENQAKDETLAKQCKEKADEAMRAMVGANVAVKTDPSDPSSVWSNELYPGLLSTSDPDNATKAVTFLTKNPSYQTFNNYIWIGYAYERKGDFQNAIKYYEIAMTKRGDERNEHHSYAFYVQLLCRMGNFTKAEEIIRRMERLSTEAVDLLKTSYKSELLVAKVVYCLNIGDYSSLQEVAQEQYEYYKGLYAQQNLQCDPFTSTVLTYMALAKESLKNYTDAGELWRQRDEKHNEWIDCHTKQFPNNKQYMLSMWPVFLMQTGQMNKLPKPISFYINELQESYNSYRQYQDFRHQYMEARHLAFLKAPEYHSIFKGVLDYIDRTKDFGEATNPFSYYAYFTMRDRQYDLSAATYDRLFKLNVQWINDVIFSFGEKAFVAYYNARLREGYDNYHSFVKLAKDNKTQLFPSLVSQAYNNLLFTKSLSLKGTQKRKQAFRKANDPATLKLYDDWIDKKQQLLRMYRKSEDATSQEGKPDLSQLKKLQDEVTSLENELTAKAKGFKQYLSITPPDWRSIQAKLNEGEAAVEMIRFQWRNQQYYSDSIYYAAYYITKNSAHPNVVYLPASAQDLENKHYKLYQNSIKFKLKDENSYIHFWKPVMDELKGIKKIFFSPDGIYHLISIPTLFNPGTGKYMLDDLDFQYTTSSADVAEPSSSPDVRTAVLFGRPSYEVTGGKLQTAPIASETRSLVASFRSNAINDLPGTEEEVMVIKNEMDKRAIKTSLYLRDQASEEKIYQLQSPDILHIATHGYWSSSGTQTTEGFRLFNAMANSGLLMAGVVNYYKNVDFPDTYDGIITAYEAQNLNLDNTSLVILSACETSLGHMDAGEGVYGLQRAFRAAGAKSIMTSLWKVDDAATKDFMIMFYQNYLSSKNKFDAFRSAQRSLKEKYPEPYYWGAFTLAGN